MNATRCSFSSLVKNLATLFALSALGACSGGSNPGPTTPNSVTPTSKDTPSRVLLPHAFASDTEFKSYYAKSLAAEYFTGYSYDHNCFGCDPGILMSTGSTDGSEGAPAFSPQASPDREVTETNTQETGVDEADLIETNPTGTEIYVLRRETNELLVIETADPSNLRVLSRTAMPADRQPAGMFFDVEEKSLSIILNQYAIYYFGAPAVSAAGDSAAKSSFAPGPDFQQGTLVQFYDVSNPSSPRLHETLSTDGQYVDARRVGSRLHLVTQFGFPYASGLYEDAEFSKLAYEDYPQAYYNKDESEMARLRPLIQAKIEQAVQAMPVADLLPKLGTELGPDATGLQMLPSQSILRPDVSTRMGLLMISSIDTDGANLSTLGTINNAWQVYSSAENLYLLQNSGGWWFDTAQRQQTAIYRFDMSSGSASTAPVVGLIDGWPQTSYQLSEFDGHLRSATTEGRYNGPNGRFTQHNHLTVLNVASMTQTGAVKDFVHDKGETIRGVRFLGARGFVVTFLNQDPLFAFDLSNPNDPVLRDELEIPGFSSYIHPLGDNYLLTIGRAPGANDLNTGNSYQLQIFDVTDLSDIRQFAVASPLLNENEYAFSVAENDPHGFTYLEQGNLLTGLPQGLLSIPVMIGSPQDSRALSGFVAYRINVADGENAISEYTRVDHKQAPDQNNTGERCPSNRTDLPPPEDCDQFAPQIYSEPLRSVIFSESGLLPGSTTTTLLTLSSHALISTDVSGDTAQENDTLKLDPAN